MNEYIMNKSNIYQYEKHGKIDLIINDTIAASTSDFPIYNGDFWNIFIGVSGSTAATNDIKIDPSAADMVLEYMLFIDG